MEKFGIFELLDVLSAATATARNDPSSAEETASMETEAGGKNPAETVSAETETGGKTSAGVKKAFDPAFSAPAYGQPPAPVQEGASALDGFLARHEKAKGRIGK